jgi:hypothetical protein
MRLRLIFLNALALAAIALGVVAAQPQASATPRFGMVHANVPVAPVRFHPFRIQCDRPSTLHLARFEDGSARLECARRVLVLISVPG